MIIEKLIISFAIKGNMQLFEQHKTYEFKNKTLITSKGENSRGKTTLIRFILFSLGFNVPLTDGMNSQDFKTNIEFTNNGTKFIVKRENSNIEVFRDNLPISNEGNHYLLNVFSIKNYEELDNILGCFYIDQEKGWTLLNRGRIIGKRSFNIERFVSFINQLTDVQDKIKKNERIEIENKKIKILEDIKSLKEEMDSTNSFIETKNIAELNRDISLINSKISSLKHEKNSLNNLLKEHLKFIKRLSLLQLKVKVDDKVHPLTTENVIGFDIDDKFILLEIKDIDNQIDIATKNKKSLEEKLEYIQEKQSIDGIDTTISKINISDSNLGELLTKKNKNFEIKRKNKKFIKENLDNNINEIWEIMRIILKELNVSKEYIEKNIIFRNRLSGISGTQLHKLTFALKLSLLVIIKEKLGIEVPFIIDSPRSGEVNEETANKMLELAKSRLSGSQIIISSVYDDFTLNFEKKIILGKTGVLGNIEFFLDT